ncbi:hypothetical protein BABINDRAFT_161070 [Babjeviella inositovora NRRL Y-12698]|uniref:ER membrane protein complex subunit 4 n=1 Tax=Babjeviella inositovora NRRL Y-12698 TaxID=984486 RepID=A0A1E3QV90_9ASCO|nr:uncharacterized protein BABINDRAFT_161070 [Babjeviella inositovora NRRL Y-12698]ODQ80877.1 hypothetical protein BABINDRAFT_161070 [Babjeviella inositovora NRRL Y-12698]
MSGNSLQIIPIMMTLMLFTGPLQSIITVNDNFVNLATKKNKTEVLQAKIIFILCHLGCIAVGVWKLNSLGLIPNSRSDWLAWESPVNVSNFCPALSTTNYLDRRESISLLIHYDGSRLI